MKLFDLIYCVVNYNSGSKVLRMAKQHGIKGGTIFMGRGTATNKLLQFFELTDIRKEIVLMVSKKEETLEAMKYICKEMAMHKPNHGIIFSSSIENFIGTQHLDYHDNQEETGGKKMYNAIFTVVEKGLAEDVVEAATEAGARGGTIFNARGAGVHETSMVFAMPIEPEKEMVMILSKKTDTKAITSSIRKKLKIGESGRGIIFVLGIDEAFGLSDATV